MSKPAKAGRRRRRRRRHGAPGVAPGTLAADPDALASQLQVLAYGPDTCELVPVPDLGALRSLRGRSPVLWINVTGLADIKLLQAIADAFDLHPLAMEDVANVGQRPKLEVYGQHAYIVARMTRVEALDTEQLSIFLGDGFLITFQETPGDCFNVVRDRLNSGRTRIRSSGADYLAYALLDAVIDAYFPVLERFGDRLDEFELQILARADSRMVASIHGIRRELLGLRRAIWPLREVVNALMRDDHPWVKEETRLFLRDAYDHTIQIIDVVETHRELAAGLMDMYLSILSHRMNEVMKVLTIIATIFIPLTFVAGIYGMNFAWMPELGWKWGYPVALAVMAVTGIALVFYFRRKGWIGKAVPLAEPAERHELPPPARPGAAPPASAPGAGGPSAPSSGVAPPA